MSRGWSRSWLRVVAAAGSATSSSNNHPPPHGGAGQPARASHHRRSRWSPRRALGLWRSTFGAVKIEADNSKGGLQTGAVQGVWVYQRQGQEVVGYFSGNLRGNVLAVPLAGAEQPAADRRGLPRVRSAGPAVHRAVVER